MEAVEDTSEKYTGSIVNKLESAIGAENVKTSKTERLLYSHDMAPLPKEADVAFKLIPDIVVRPRSTEDVAKVVKIAAQEGVPITPRGASSWGLAGSVTAFGGILLDMMGGMGKILNIDEENLTMTCQAGVSWKQAYDAAWEKGMLLGSYPSSAPSATLAGWISTAGIGVGNYKYGSAGDNIRSMKVVIPDGSIVDTGFETLSDNMSGYNLNRLFVGAEGTLGVICEVTFKLTPRPEVLRPIAYEFESLDKTAGPPHGHHSQQGHPAAHRMVRQQPLPDAEEGRSSPPHRGLCPHGGAGRRPGHRGSGREDGRRDGGQTRRKETFR